MIQKVKIAPSILSADFSKLGKEISDLDKTNCDYIHIDVMDGHFVPNLTIGPSVIKSLRKYTKLPFDVHLMIDPVHKYIKDYSEAGADIITFHPEATENILETINLIKSLNKKVGISLNPDTQIKAVQKNLDKIDLVLIMSVYPGFGGQKFIDSVVKKIKDLNEIREKNKLNFKIEIDGGINFVTSKIAIDAGVDILVSGTTVFKENNGDLKKNIEILKQT